MTGIERWTPEELEKLEKLLKEKHSFGVIARILKRSRASISGKARRIREKEAGQLNLFLET